MAARFVLSVISAALICGILQSIVKEGSCARVLKILCGIFLIITVLKPLKKIEFPDLSQWTASWEKEAEDAVRDGKQVYEKEYASGIQARLQAYILDKAAQLGLSVRVDIALSTDNIPESVIISGTAGKREREQLETILTRDLGIPKEKQQWNE